MFNKKENFAHKIKFSHEQIETVLQDMPLQFSKHKDYEIENKIAFNPPFVYEFYNFILDKLRLPNQMEFANYYVNKNKTSILKKGVTESKIPFLKARLFRTYPSIIRDFHFYNYLRDNGIDVFFNPVVDFEDGHDLIIGDYSINLYTDTDRGNSFRSKKPKRHAKDDLIEMNLPLTFSESKKCGSFFLYNDSHYEKIINIINKKP